jgi:hypothetical protein
VNFRAVVVPNKQAPVWQIAPNADRNPSAAPAGRETRRQALKLSRLITARVASLDFSSRRSARHATARAPMTQIVGRPAGRETYYRIYNSDTDSLYDQRHQLAVFAREIVARV